MKNLHICGRISSAVIGGNIQHLKIVKEWCSHYCLIEYHHVVCRLSLYGLDTTHFLKELFPKLLFQLGQVWVGVIWLFGRRSHWHLRLLPLFLSFSIELIL